MPSRSRPVDAANQIAFGRKVAPRLQRRARRLGGRDVGVERLRRRRSAAAPTPPGSAPGSRTSGPEGARASRLPPPGDPGQRPGAAEDGAAGACRRPPRVRDLAVQPRQRRPRRRPRRGEVGILPLPVDLDRFSPLRTTPGRRRSTIQCSSSSGARTTRARTSACCSTRCRCSPACGLLLVGEPPDGAAPPAGRGDRLRPVDRPVPAPGHAARRSRRTRRASGSPRPRRWRPACPW